MRKMEREVQKPHHQAADDHARVIGNGMRRIDPHLGYPSRTDRAGWANGESRPPRQGDRSMSRWTRALTRAEWIRLSGFAGAVLFLHLVGWGLFLYYARHNPSLARLGS